MAIVGVKGSRRRGTRVWHGWNSRRSVRTTIRPPPNLTLTTTGTPPEALDLLDDAVEIPMVGTASSLNLAVAGSLVLYKLAGLL